MRAIRIPTRNAPVALPPDIPLRHRPGDCASDHDRGNAIHWLLLFPTRAIDGHVPVFPVCALEALEQYRINPLVDGRSPGSARPQ